MLPNNKGDRQKNYGANAPYLHHISCGKKMSSTTSKQIHLRDGRALGYAEFGDPAGKPVFFFHGLPGSRLQRYPDDPTAIPSRPRTTPITRPPPRPSPFHPPPHLPNFPPHP